MKFDIEYIWYCSWDMMKQDAKYGYISSFATKQFLISQWNNIYLVLIKRSKFFRNYDNIGALLKEDQYIAHPMCTIIVHHYKLAHLLQTNSISKWKFLFMQCPSSAKFTLTH